MSLEDSPVFATIREFSKKFPQYDFSKLESCVYLIHLGRLIQETMDAHFARHNLSKGRFQILANLKRNDGLAAPAELAEVCGVTRATVTGLVDTLEAAGLVERVQDSHDRRSVQVKLTPAGERHLDEMLPDHFHRVSTLMSGLTQAERDTLMGLLAKIEAQLPSVREP